MKRSRAVIAVVTIVAAGATLAAQNSVEQRIRRIENGLLPPVVLKGRPIKTTKLEDRIRELKIPAVSMAVFHNGRIDWLRAWGMADVAERRRADPDTRFQAASISKPVAAAAALALVSRGRLSLDQDINTHLTSWKLPDNELTRSRRSAEAPVDASGGVTVSVPRLRQREDVPTLVQLLDGVKPANSAAVRVDIPVGSRWRYAGGGYSIVQLAIEDETKKPFAQAARELVLEPFGMSRSTFVQPIPADLREKAATGYRAGGEAVAGNWHTYPEQAAAGLWTTPKIWRALHSSCRKLRPVSRRRSCRASSPRKCFNATSTNMASASASWARVARRDSATAARTWGSVAISSRIATSDPASPS
jgi:CubicO group peptidase (beta-lactamase class C family)